MRLFLAIALPEALRARLADLGRGLPGVRWLPPENLHLTLRFIGEVDRSLAEELDAALGQIRAPGFSLTLAGVGCFGAGEKVRSIWAGVETNPDLLGLQVKIEAALRRAGLPPEGRKFKPHVTLARLKGRSGVRLQDFLARGALYRGASFQVEDFVLFSSFLSQSGAIYTPEAAYPLRDFGPPTGRAAAGSAGR